MSDSRAKIRSLFLAMLMVFSVVGGSIAFAGSAAAANTAAGNSSLTNNQVPADSTNNHTVTLNATDVDTSGDGPQVFSVNFTNPDAVDLSSASVTASVNEGNVTIDGFSPDTTSGTLNVTLNDSGGVSSEDVSVTLDLTNLGASSTSTSTDVQFGVDANNNGNLSDANDAPFAPFATLTIGAGSTTPDTVVRAQVTDQDGNSVSTSDTGVQVDIINTSGSDTVVEANVNLNNQGRTKSVPVLAGQNYTINLSGTGAAQLASASTVTPADGETREIDVTIQRLRQADELVVNDTDPDDAATDVDSDVRFDILANDTNTLTDGPTGPVSGTDVDATIIDASNTSAASISPTTNATDSSGIASFNATSSVPQTVTVEFSLSSNSSINTTATATFGAIRGNNTITGQVRTNATEQFSGATVYAVETGSNQSLAFSEATRQFAIDETTETGGYVLNDLRATTEYNVYVIASGFNRIAPGQTASEINGFVARNQTVNTSADGDTTTADFTIQPSDAVFEYELNVTLTDASPDESTDVSDKSARIPDTGSVTAQVDVDRRRAGSTGSFSPAEDEEIDIEPTSTGILDPNTQSVVTDSSGQATVTLDGQTPGTSNVTASLTNSEGTEFNATDAEQAEVTVFGTAEITGQVVNDDQQALAGGQADVELQVENTSSGAFESTGRTKTIDNEGRYTFLDVESGLNYRLVATTLSGDNGTAVITELSPGTTTRDIVVAGVEPRASVTLNNATVDSGTTTVTVESADLPDGGFVVIHDSNLSEVGAVPSVIGASTYLEPGTTGNVVIQLDRPVENETLIAMAHRDTNGNEEFDFVSSGGSADGPYTSQGQPVIDSATFSVESNSDSPLGDTASQFDDNEDGEITAVELGDAVDQFGAGDLTAVELGEVVDAFAQS